MEIPAKMMADPRLLPKEDNSTMATSCQVSYSGDDENGCGDDMRLQSGGFVPLWCIFNYIFLRNNFI